MLTTENMFLNDFSTFFPPAILQHFSFIATYSWLNVVCFGVWWMFRYKSIILFFTEFFQLNSFVSLYSSTVSLPTHKPIWGKQFFYSSVYGWGIPLVIVVVGQIVQNCDVPDYIIKPGLASKMYCWFDRKLNTHFFISL
jgi:hypothetical protein